jgi:hypothetical protein
MNSITQAEFNRQFAEYVKDKEVNRDNILELKLQYIKILKEQELTVRAGVEVDKDGNIVHEPIS